MCATPQSSKSKKKLSTSVSAKSKLILKPGKEKALLRYHPWVFSGAIAEVIGNPQLGDTVPIFSSDGQFLAQGAYSPHSQIRARVWTWLREEVIDTDFFRRRLQQAIKRRQAVATASENALRLVHSEADGLPGFIIDRYADTLVMQVLSAGAEKWRGVVADALLDINAGKQIYERSDVDVRELEGLPPRAGVLRGSEPATRIEIVEGKANPRHYLVDVRGGQKTGFYLDQKENRSIVATLAKEKEVLNCFCYTGGFSIAALLNGAKSVLSIDSSNDALQLARENLRLNNLSEDKAQWLAADVFKGLRELRDQGKNFDLIILDPPKFAPTSQHVEKAARAYKDINLLAFKLLRPEGVLVTFSCSSGITADLFQKIIAGAAADADIDARITMRLTASADHPVLLSFPEGDYLKGLICQRV